jgi:sugar lactone lactonase YvrE
VERLTNALLFRVPRALPVIFAAAVLFLLNVQTHPVAAADMQQPLAVAAAADGTLYVADGQLPGIWKIAAGKRTTYFAADKKFRTPLNSVRCLAVDGNGMLLAGDSATRDVYRFDESNKPVPLTAGKIGIPMGIAVDKKGDILVTDLETHRIMKVPAAGGEPAKVVDVPAPQSLAVDVQDRIWVVSRSPKQLYRISPDGKAEPFLAEQPMAFPHGIALDSKGVACVSDGYGKAIWKIDESAKASKWAEGAPFVNPMGIALHGETLFVADSRAKQIFQVDASGKITPLAATEE